MRRTIVLIAVVAVVGGLLAACSRNEEFPTGGFRSTASVGGGGPVTVTYNEDGTLLIEQSGVTADGTYTVDGDQVTMSDSYCRDQGFETATYTWKLDGSTLTMTTSNDGCTDRKEAVAEMTAVK